MFLEQQIISEIVLKGHVTLKTHTPDVKTCSCSQRLLEDNNAVRDTHTCRNGYTCGYYA